MSAWLSSDIMSPEGLTFYCMVVVVCQKSYLAPKTSREGVHLSAQLVWVCKFAKAMWVQLQ